MSSRIAHHIDFPDYGAGELLAIGSTMLGAQNYRFGAGAAAAFESYLGLRLAQPHFANPEQELSKEDLMTIEASDILASRVFGGGLAP